jgi:hypothetical protein
MRRPIIDDHRRSFTIGQIISALDDRNLTHAMRLLEPAAESAEPTPSPDRDDASRCVRCATRGE